MASFQPDWTNLKQHAVSYADSSPLLPEISEVTPRGGYSHVGLYGDLAEIVKDAIAVANPLSRGLVIALDTLVIPAGETSIPAVGVEIIARSVEVAGGGAATLKIATGSNGAGLQVTTAQIHGTVHVSLEDSSGAPLGGSPALTLAAKTATPQVLTVASSKPDEVSATNQSSSVADVMHSPWSILALELSFAAAGSLVEDDNRGALLLASSMLRWVTGSCFALLKLRASFTTVDYDNVASLQTNSVALLTYTQAANSNATYVPILSADIYQSEINALLKVAEVYDQKISELKQQENIEKLLSSFAETLGNISATAEAPLFNTLKRLDLESASVQSQLRNDAIQLWQVSDTLKPLQEALEKAIEDQEQAELAEAAVKTFFTVLTLYLGAAAIVADPALIAGEVTAILKAAAELAEKLAEAGEQIIEAAIEEGTTSASGPPSVAAAEKAKQGAEALVGSQVSFGQAVADLWAVVNQAIAGGQNRINFSPNVLKVVEKFPNLSGFSVGGLDPVTYWESVVIQVKASVKPFESGSITGAPAAAYLEAMELASTYGKGVADQQMKLLDLYTQGMSAFDRLRAVYQAEAQWKNLQAKLKDQEAQLNAAIGLLQRGYTDVKRSLIVAVNNYRAAFHYQWLQPSDVKIDASMDYLQLVQAAENSVTSLEDVLQGTSSETVRPRQDFNNIVYHVRRGYGPLFRDVDGKGQAEWSITLDDLGLADQISRNTAIYLTEAKFELEGASQTSEVELQIETSGSFDNQLGDSKYRFVSSAISMVNDYRPGNPPHFITPWKFADADRAAYLKPAPYTQWKLTVDKGDWKDVTSIKITLAGIFLQNPQ